MSETESKCVKFKNASDLKYSCRDPTRQITRSLPGDVPRNVLESPGQRKFVTRRKLGLAALSNTSLKPEDSEDKSNWNFRRGQVSLMHSLCSQVIDLAKLEQTWIRIFIP